jgi:hypothetical protein
MADLDPWQLYSSEDEPTHLARPDTQETYCGELLTAYRTQGSATDPSAFHIGDQFCVACIQAYLGEQGYHPKLADLIQ